jgi:hypothetical protein
MNPDEPIVEPAAGELWDAENVLEKAIIAFDKKAYAGNAILTGWVMIAEWIDENGDPALSAFAREGMPYWRIDGLLASAPEQLMYVDPDDY